MTERRTYKITIPGRGIRAIPVYEFRRDGEADRMVLELHEESRPDSIDIVQGLQRAYSDGREDRSEEILGDAGLTRAVAELELHEAQARWQDTSVCCACGRFERGSAEEWQRHLAYEILQAAGRLP